MNKCSFISLICLYFLFSCGKDSIEVNSNCPQSLAIITQFINQDGQRIRIYEDGKAYIINDSDCNFAAQYYDPDFYTDAYLSTDTGVVLIVSDGIYLSPYRKGVFDFEGPEDVLELFKQDISQDERILNSFTLQSPSAPSVDEYVDLRQCIWAGTCDFIDNKFELIQDPINNTNTVLKCFAVAPSPDMVTSKTSLSTTLSYFEAGDDFWFEARFFIMDNLPTTLADFESTFFLEGPGPRIIFRGDKLAIENKFNEKITYNQPELSARPFPLNQWVTVKVHLNYDANNGIIQMWQDGELIIDQTGPNIPFDLWIMDRIEFGISATSNECNLYVDDLRFSDVAF